jgi:hypothetical protein
MAPAKPCIMVNMVLPELFFFNLCKCDKRKGDTLMVWREWKCKIASLPTLRAAAGL